MCYDSPKAAHFRAFSSGRLLPWNDATGLAARWQAAELAKEFGCHDMLPGRRNMEAIRLAVAMVNRRDDYVTVELDNERIS